MSYRHAVTNLIRSLISKKTGTPMASPDYALQYGADWKPIVERTMVDYPEARCLGRNVIDIDRMVDAYWPAAGLLTLEDPYLFGRYGWIFSNEGYFLFDHSWYGQHHGEIKDLPVRLLPTRTLKGTTLTLASEWSGENYGHLLLDSLSRLSLVEKAGHSLADFDQIVLSRQRRASIEGILRVFGVPAEKVVYVDDGEVLRAQRLVAPTFPGSRRIYPPWVVAFLGNYRPNKTPTGTQSRKLYISRAGSARNAANQGEVESLMQKLEFEIYDPGLSSNSRADFAQAGYVVGLSGAGLADIAFCLPGTKILELIPTDHAYPYYYTLASAGAMNYGYLACQSVKNRAPDSWGPSNSDVMVDIDELQSAMQALEASISTARRGSHGLSC